MEEQNTTFYTVNKETDDSLFSTVETKSTFRVVDYEEKDTQKNSSLDESSRTRVETKKHISSESQIGSTLPKGKNKNSPFSKKQKEESTEQLKSSRTIESISQDALIRMPRVIAEPLKDSDNYALESTGKVLEATSKSASRIKQIVYATRRQIQRSAQKKAVAAAATTGATTGVVTASSSGVGLYIVLGIFAAFVIFIFTAFLLILMIAVMSASTLAVALTNNFYHPLEHYHFISSSYGEREVMKINGTNTNPFHTGIDIPAPEGTPVGASTMGTVTTVVISDTGYGNYVHIKHENGYETRYAHMAEVFVSVGQEVYPTEIIGTVGMSGTANGYHLHFELWQNGVQIDPSSQEYLSWDEYREGFEKLGIPLEKENEGGKTNEDIP